MSTTKIDRQKFSDEAMAALSHPLVVDVIAEQLLNLGSPRDSLVHYGLSKIAFYAATVARAQALGIDPDALRATPDEAAAAMVARAESLGVPTTVVVVGDDNTA